MHWVTRLSRVQPRSILCALACGTRMQRGRAAHPALCRGRHDDLAPQPAGSQPRSLRLPPQTLRHAVGAEGRAHVAARSS
jgi:hypothetical protein